MKIERIELADFRSIGADGIVLEPSSGLNVIVGENNAGKSSIFAAVAQALASSFGSFPDRADDRFGDRRPNLKLKVAFDTADEDGLVELLFDQGIQGLAQQDKRALPEHLSELLRLWPDATFEVAPNPGSGFASTFTLGRYITSGSTIRSGSGGSNIDAQRLLDHESNPRDLTPAAYFQQEAKGFQLQNDVRVLFSQYVARQMLSFLDVRSRPTSVAGSKDMHSSLAGGQTAALLHSLRLGSPDRRSRYASIKRRFEEFFPELTVEAVGESDQNPRLVFASRARPDFDIEQAHTGTGVLEALTLIANLEGRRGYVFVIEEPELHLHPHHQRALMREIVKVTDTNQVFVITHSPHFIDTEHLDGLTRVSASPNGTALSRLPNVPDEMSVEELATMKENLRFPEAREMFFARAVLLVEGPTEVGFLQTIGPRIGKDLDSHGVSLISVDGQEKGKYRPYIRILDAMGMRYLCHRDKGPTGIPPDQRARFRFIGAEFEDYLRAEGLGELLDEAEAAVGVGHKPQVGRYVGSHVDQDRIPAKFIDLLKEICELAGPVIGGGLN